MTEVLSIVESESGLYDLPEDLNSQTPIQNSYSFWYHRRGSKTQSNYEESMKIIASFQTVEHFWRVYDHLIRPNEFKFTTDYHLFKEGVKPTWEDPANKQGGKWMIRLKKGLASHYWEEIILSIIGEQFDVGNEICGAVCSIRTSEDIISIWNRTADNLEANNKIRDHMRRVLKLPSFIAIEYKKHEDSLADKSSYRNPSVVWRAPATTGRAPQHNDRAYGRAEATRPDYSGNRQDHYNHHGLERSNGQERERGDRQHASRGSERENYQSGQPAKTAWKGRVESTGDPVRDRENQQKEADQHKKEEKEKEGTWSSRTGGDGWTTSSKSALASGRDDVAASSPPGGGWTKPSARVQGDSTAASSWFRSKGTDRPGVEPAPVAGPQTPVFSAGAMKKKVPPVTGQADKVDVWSRGRAFVAETAAPAPGKTD